MVRGLSPSGTSPDPAQNQETPIDGRAARAVRTRATIVDALLDLLHEGDLQPTANRIAERAGISLRLIYHHFGDLESLFREASAREAERLGELVEPIPDDLPLEDRIDAFVAQRSRLLEWITPVRLASLLHEPFSEELRAARDAFVDLGESQTTAVFAPELARASTGQREVLLAALASVCGWGLWNDLRASGRSFEASKAAVHLTITALLGS